MTTTIAVPESRTPTTDNSAIRPFQKMKFPEAELAELRRRINNTRWPERETVKIQSQRHWKMSRGMSTYVRRLKRYQKTLLWIQQQ